MLTHPAGKIYAFMKRDIKEAMSYPTAFGTEILGVVGSMLSFYFLSRTIGDSANRWISGYADDYFSFALVGLAFSNYLQVALNSFRQAIRYSQMIGTMELMLVSRASIAEIVLYSAAYSFIWTTIVTAVYFAVGKLCFHVVLARINWLSTIVVFMLMILSLIGFGIISAGLTIIFKKNDPFTLVIGAVSIALAGTIYPTSILPHWLRIFAESLPMTIGIMGLRQSILQGMSVVSMLPQILKLAIWTLVLVPLALCILQYCTKVAKRYGMLANY